LSFTSFRGDAVLTPKLVRATEIDTPYDLVFLSVKAYALEAAMNDFAAAVGPETMILSVPSEAFLARHAAAMTNETVPATAVRAELFNGGKIFFSHSIFSRELSPIFAIPQIDLLLNPAAKSA
jgi:2-dehydropantoate 2-reductase